jgi:two-component system, OmpR family, phosphate regulon sensor histidine kinase PhoR
MQSTRKLQWKLLPSYLGITLMSILIVGWYAVSALTELANRQTVTNLLFQARLVGSLVGDRFSFDKSLEINELLQEFGQHTPARVSVLVHSGQIVAESRTDVSRLKDRLSRPEIEEARAGKTGVDQRFSFGAGEELVYVAVPIQVHGQYRGIVRISLPATSFSFQLRAVYEDMALACVAILGLSAIVSLYVARRVNSPVSRLAEGARRFESGDLTHKLNASGWAELSLVFDAMNAMAARLHDRIVAVIQQRNELQAVLGGMVEAVLVVDSDERIARMNTAAERLFRTTQAKAKGRAVQEVIRNTELHEFVSAVFANSEPAEADITILGDPERFLQAHGANLRDDQGRSTGALVVLNDVTRLKTLENIRRDFVANVSHELKTPITSIKGFLETLKEGALNDPVNAERFLDIIIAQTDRLDVIIEDLLTLSRVEQDSEKGDVVLQDASINEVVEAVVKACRFKAEEKNIQLQGAIEEEFTARINATLLEQAIVNLVDNAIKYSEPGKTIRVEVARKPHEIAIAVTDQGCGIPKEHLNRIFERFYRVDKARSRKVGGTGLGLSIVKHIAHAHAGRVTVESSPGRGSTFTVLIPVSEGI